jgi:hypothetical protein
VIAPGAMQTWCEMSRTCQSHHLFRSSHDGSLETAYRTQTTRYFRSTRMTGPKRGGERRHISRISASVATLGGFKQFRNGAQFGDWLGLVPNQLLDRLGARACKVVEHPAGPPLPQGR